jgi:hypothetical protein
VRCDFCQGSGLAVLPNHVVPCSECGGFGTIQPCEGLRAQPVSELGIVVNELNMATRFAWAAQSNQRSSNQVRVNRDSSSQSAGWRSLTTDFPFNEANTSLG